MATTFAVDTPSTKLSATGKKVSLFEVEWRGGMSNYLGQPGIKAAKGWLESLRRMVSNHLGRPGVDGVEPLRQEIVRLYQDGRYHEAEVEARRLVELQKETVGENHPEFATALTNLALLLQQQGDLNGAEVLLTETLEIRRKELGERHPEFAATLNHLALLLLERSEFDSAEPLLRQGLEIRRVVLGEAHPDYATGLSSLALVLCGRGDLAGAEPLLRQALEIRRQTLGEQHPEYATGLNNLGLLLAERFDPKGAEPLLRLALEIRRGVLGPQHPDTRSTSEALSMILSQTRRVPEQTNPQEIPPPTSGLPFTVPAEPLRVSTAMSQTTLEVDGSAPAPAPAPHRTMATDPPPRGTKATTRTSADLLEDFASLTLEFKHTGEALFHQASRIQRSGLPPDPLTLAEASHCHRLFTKLRNEALQLASDLPLPTSTSRKINRLEDLESLLRAIAAAEVDRSRREESIQSSFAIIDYVLVLRHQNSNDQSVLDPCRTQAANLRSSISSCPPSEWPSDAEALSDGSHPLSHLVALMLNNRDESEDDWESHFQVVATTFGKELAVAIARGRIVDQT